MKRVLAAAAAAVALALVFPQVASAGVNSVGWFTRNPAASAPEGGLQVANAPDGIVSFGAISALEDGKSITSATVTLKEAGQQVNAATATLRACRAAGSFKSGRGTFAQGPKADCDLGTAEIKRDASGTWTGDVTSLVAGAETPAIAIVPAPGAGLFQVTFGPPDLTVETSSSGSGTDASSFDASEFGGSSGGSDSSSGSGSFSSDEFAGSSSSSGSTFEPSSSSGSFSTTAGSTFSPSSFDTPLEAGSPTLTVDPSASAPTVEAAAAPPSGETALPTRPRLTGEPASATTADDAGKKFVFFALAAALIGAGAGFGRNRLVTARTS